MTLRTNPGMPDARPIIVIGATGRVGRIVRAHWPGNAPLWTARDGRAGWLHWAAGDPLPPARALVMLAGPTPATGGALDESAALVTAALSAADTAGIPRGLIASSAAVYGAQAGSLAETAPLCGDTAYARAKQAVEAACAPWRARMEVCALRIGNVVGADALLAGNPARLEIDTFADGLTPLRSWIGGAGLARVLAALCDARSALPAVLNLASPRPWRMADIAAAAGVPVTLRPAPPTAIPAVTLDMGALSRCVPLPDDDPAAMVAQWRTALGVAVR
jgi:UDP-glucose 4-epimerase